MRERMLAGAAVTALLLMVPAGAGAAPTTRVKCGDTIERSVRVANDLVNCPADGLVVVAPGVTVDLGGHTIDGTGNGAGVRVEGQDDVAVTRGRVQQFAQGVALTDGVDRALVERVTARDSFIGFWLANGVRDSEVVRSTATGGYAGVHLFLAYENLVSRVSTANNQQGIVLNEASNNVVERNRFAATTQTGVHVFAASGNRIAENSGSGNDVGVRVDQSPGGNLLLRNRFVAPRTAGIQIFESGGVVLDSNTIRDSGGDGIHVGAGSAGVRLIANDASRNAGDGIEVQSLPATIARNRAFFNGGWGIVAPAGATDGGRNRAAHNGIPAQCAGVRCSR